MDDLNWVDFVHLDEVVTLTQHRPEWADYFTQVQVMVERAGDLKKQQTDIIVLA